MEQQPLVITKLVESYTVLVMAKRRTIEEVPSEYAYRNETYNLRELTEIEIAERTIATLS